MRQNYSGNKRRREDAQRKKQEEKRNKRLNKSKFQTASDAGMDSAQTPLHDPDARKFFIPLGTEEAALDYKLDGSVIEFHHTFVPDSSRGKGVAEKLVTAGFEYARENALQVIPTCPYVSGTFLERHPEYRSLVQ